MNIIITIARSFIPNFKVGYVELKTQSAELTFKTKFIDLISVLRSTGFFLVFAIIAAVVFLIISPGRDALLLVIENTSEGHIGSLISLLIGVFIWSIVAEFGVRYSIYVTDNSGKSLSMARVEWRKMCSA